MLEFRLLFTQFKNLERVSTEPPLFTGEKKHSKKHEADVDSAVSTAHIKDD